MEVSTRKEVDQIRQNISQTRERFASQLQANGAAANKGMASGATRNNTNNEIDNATIASANSLPGSRQDHTSKLRAQNRNGQTLTFLPSNKRAAKGLGLCSNQRAIPLTPFQVAASTHTSNSQSRHARTRSNRKENESLRSEPTEELRRTHSDESNTSNNATRKQGVFKCADYASVHQQQSAASQTRQQARNQDKSREAEIDRKQSKQWRSVSQKRRRPGKLKVDPGKQQPSGPAKRNDSNASSRSSDARKQPPKPKKKSPPRRTVSASPPEKSRPSTNFRSSAPPSQVLDASIAILRAMEKEEGKQSAAAAPNNKERLSDNSQDPNSLLRAVAKERQYDVTESQRSGRKVPSSSKRTSYPNTQSETPSPPPPPQSRRQRSQSVHAPLPPPPNHSRQRSEPMRRTRPRHTAADPRAAASYNHQNPGVTSNRRTTATAETPPPAPAPAPASANNNNTQQTERRLRVEQTPGAVRVTGVNNHGNDDDEQPPSPRPSSEFNNNTAATTSDSNLDLLIEARLVDADSAQFVSENVITAGDLVQAQPLQDKEMRCRDALRSKRIRRSILLAAFLMGAIILAIILGFTLTRPNSDNNNSGEVDTDVADSSAVFIPVSPDTLTISPAGNVPPNPATTTNPTIALITSSSPTTGSPTIRPTSRPVTTKPSTPPTSLPSRSPSASPIVVQPDPTVAPTALWQQNTGVTDNVSTEDPDTTNNGVLRFIDDWFDGRVPESFVEAVRDPNSPQSRAQEWLRTDLQLRADEQFRSMQRLALAVFYYATNGDSSWYSNHFWLDHATSECDWFQNKEACPHGEGYFSQLALIEHQLSGSLPPEFFWLTGLSWLDVSRNNIGGTLPTQVGLMSALSFLILDETSISGQLPSQIGHLMIMNSLAMSSMPNLFGTLPTEIGRMDQLATLAITESKVSGVIPTHISKLTLLSYMTLDNNNLGGMLPTQLGRLGSLFQLSLINNVDIAGTIPSEFGKMTTLNFLHLTGTSLWGSIPEELCNLGLVELEVEGNVGACL